MAGERLGLGSGRLRRCRALEGNCGAAARADPREGVGPGGRKHLPEGEGLGRAERPSSREKGPGGWRDPRHEGEGLERGVVVQCPAGTSGLGRGQKGETTDGERRAEQGLQEPPGNKTRAGAVPGLSALTGFSSPSWKILRAVLLARTRALLSAGGCGERGAG